MDPVTAMALYKSAEGLAKTAADTAVKMRQQNVNVYTAKLDAVVKVTTSLASAYKAHLGYLESKQKTKQVKAIERTKAREIEASFARAVLQFENLTLHAEDRRASLNMLGAALQAALAAHTLYLNSAAEEGLPPELSSGLLACNSDLVKLAGEISRAVRP